MKTIITFTFALLVFASDASAQKTTNEWKPGTEPRIPLSAFTETKDTLWLVESQTGRLIYTSWFVNGDPSKPAANMPVIIFKNQDWIIAERRRREQL